MFKKIRMKDSLFAILMLIWLIDENEAVYHNSTITLSVRSPRYDTWVQDSFIRLPLKTTSRQIGDYEKVELEKDFEFPLDLYCLCGDPRFCLFYDYNGHISGMQISYPKCDVSGIDPNIYDFTASDFIETNFYDTPAYSVRIYIKNPRNLTETEPNHELVVFEGLWTVLSGRLVKYDVECQPNSPYIPKGRFGIQGCTPQLGLVYIRGFPEEDKCRNGFYLFLLFAEGKLVGFGHMAPGIVSPGLNKQMFNYPSGAGLAEVIPDPPRCWDEMIKQYGLSALNIFIADDPRDIRCPNCHCSG